MKVYAEHGALHPGLVQLQRRGLIQLVTFPYENRNRHIPGLAVPSEAQWCDLGHITWGEMKFRWEDSSASEKFSEILRVVGTKNRRDALHLDSAYKSGCEAMLSRDKHIFGKATALHDLLGLRVFDPDRDWERFVQFVTTHSEHGTDAPAV